MAAPIEPIFRDTGTICWQCGAPASDACAYSLRLVAASRSGLRAPGCLVKRGDRQDEVRVRVPRCPDCRLRTLVSIGIIFAVTLAAMIAAPILQSVLWPRLSLPFWLVASDQGTGNTATGVGLVLGFVVALLSVVLHRRLSGIRPVTTYPPVVMLRREGWHFPVGGGAD